MKKSLLTILITLNLYAGDPCPITFDYLNAGVPSWLDEQTVLKNFKFNQSYV